MKYLLDTHIWLWWLQDSSKLSQEGRILLSNEHNIIYVSAVSLWEVRIKQQIGKIKLPDDFLECADKTEFTRLPILFEHANTLIHLPLHHYDPFDRLLLAQAYYENLVLVTKDKAMMQYEVPLILLQE